MAKFNWKKKKVSFKNSSKVTLGYADARGTRISRESLQALFDIISDTVPQPAHMLMDEQTFNQMQRQASGVADE